jgi:hypothetical protein
MAVNAELLDAAIWHGHPRGIRGAGGRVPASWRRGGQWRQTTTLSDERAAEIRQLKAQVCRH